MTHPPEPWILHGQTYVSVWAVPRAALPPLPAGPTRTIRPVTLGGRGLLGVTWAVYEPGGVLHYREVLAAVLVRAGLRPRVSVTHAWVDSPVARDGGRELWGIPKEPAELTVTVDGDTSAVSARTAAGSVARALLRPRHRLPGRWPIRFTVVQQLGARTRSTPVQCRAGLATADATWEVEPASPLGHLAGRRPLLTVRLHDVRLVFGATARASHRR